MIKSLPPCPSCRLDDLVEKLPENGKHFCSRCGEEFKGGVMDKELVLKVILSRHFNVDPAVVTPVSRFEDLGLDGAAEIELQMLLEKQFKIIFTPYESDNMQTVQDCLDAINNKHVEE